MIASAGLDKDMQWLKKKQEDRFEIQNQVSGHSHSDRAEGKVLHRVMRARSDGWEMEAAPSHAELTVGQTGVKDGKRCFDSRSARQK